MLRALNTGVTGIRQFQTTLDAIGNNLANINTVGFKSSRVEFADTLNQTLKAATPDSSTGSRTGTASIQVGNGVEVSGVKNVFTQGAVNQTGVPTDLAISGEGFFILKNVNVATPEFFATRAGDFRTDANGFLVTNAGLRVQGFSTPIASATEYTTETPGDINLLHPATGLPAGILATASIQNINIDSNGRINVLLNDGTTYVRGQILLQKFQNPNALLKGGNNLYSGMNQAGPIGGNVSATNIGQKPNSTGLGRIDAGALEISNVDIAREFASMITTQRAFQANARVVTASDQMLQEMIQVAR